jgi:hypothetical protein
MDNIQSNHQKPDSLEFLKSHGIDMAAGAEANDRWRWEPLCSADYTWYMQQIKFAEELLEDVVNELELDGEDYEPSKPDVFSVTMRCAVPLVTWLNNINTQLCQAYKFSNSAANCFKRLETYPPTVRRSTGKSSKYAFDCLNPKQ